ncbi:MAG: hypothetical protein K5707_07295 [Clostridia bacterium]|nr:hypothetical protein [Clostridia bacterium]
MDSKGIGLWIGFIVICAIINLVSRRMKKQIERCALNTIRNIKQMSA